MQEWFVDMPLISKGETILLKNMKAEKYYMLVIMPELFPALIGMNQHRLSLLADRAGDFWKLKCPRMELQSRTF
jgi:hypothetical protein